MKFHYILDLTKPKEKYFNVTCVISELNANELFLNFPTWTPGSYLIREYQNQVEDLVMIDSKNKLIPFEKQNKSQWKFTRIKTKKVILSYRVYANSLNVRGCYFDHDLALLLPCGTFFYSENKTTITLTVKKPKTWKLAISKKPKNNTYHFKDFDEFYDTPLMASPNLTTKTFKTKLTQYKMVFWGTCYKDLDAIVSDTKKLVEKENLIFKTNPCKTYVFFVVFTKEAPGGGLEHAHSSVNLIDGTTLDKTDKYNNFVSLLAHEHFHLWNGKRIRPKGLGPFDYSKETYTKDLWLVEGVTRYYDDHFLMRAKICDHKTYLQFIANTITKLAANKAAKVNSLSDSSFDTWIRYYMQNENSFNRTVCYYSQGSLVMLLLDLLIIKHTKTKASLDNVMRELFKWYQQNPNQDLTREVFICIVKKTTGFQCKKFLTDYIDNIKHIVWNLVFEPFGILIKKEQDNKRYFLGLILKQSGENIIIQNIAEDSPAYFSTLQPGDEIIAINNERMETTSQLEHFLTTKKLNILFNRKGRILQEAVTLKDKSKPKYTLEIKTKLRASQKKHLNKFLRKS